MTPVSAVEATMLTTLDAQPPPPAANEQSRPARWEHFDDIVAYATYGNSEQAHIEFIKNNRRALVAEWRVRKKSFPDLDPDAPELLEYLIRLKSFIRYLQTVKMTPRIYDELKSLHGIINNPEFKYPAFIVKEYNILQTSWEASRFGAADVDGNEDEGDGSDEGEPAHASSAGLQRRSGNLSDHTVEFPRDDDPIWGLNGIMHGILRSNGGGRTTYSWDPRFILKKRNCQVFGHNGLKPGDWWPLQRVALFRGAHGSSMGGIAGRAGEGAHSIVVGSTQYDGLDRDEGHTIWYSGSHSHDNKDPNSLVDSNATKLLLHSLSSRRPIRVLRKKNEHSRWAPHQGIRYDGLYRAVECHNAFNKLGGLYRQFKLERLPVGAADLSDLNPSTLQEARDKMSDARQQEIWDKVQRGYVPRPRR